MPQFEYVTSVPARQDTVDAWLSAAGSAVRGLPPGLARIPLLRHAMSTAEAERLGPFRDWSHQRTTAGGPAGTTTVTDTVTWEPARLRPGPVDERLVPAQLGRLLRFRGRQLRHDATLGDRLAATPSQVIVAGGSGLIGTQLCALLDCLGHRVTRLVRRPPRTPGEARWDPAAGLLDAGVLDGADVVVNLAGRSIGGRFTPAAKHEMLASRVDTTATICEALRQLSQERRPKVLVQASAIGIYGPRRPGEELTEASPRGPGFLADVVAAWEAATEPAQRAGVRTVLVRTGVVLSAAGGALLPQLPVFAVGFGGRLTTAESVLSWIGLDDIARVLVHAAFTDGLEGPVNAVSPIPETAAAFAAILGSVMRRPSLIPTPSLGPKLVLGAEGYDQLVDTDQRVSSKKLSDSGFRFGQRTLRDTLYHTLVS